MLAILAAFLVQTQALQLSTALDRNRGGVGEEFVLTIKAIGHSTAPFRVDLPTFDGFAVVDRSERTDVVVGTREITRAFTLELRLRAEQVGTWTISPIRVEQGTASAFSSEETVTVTSASGVAGGINPDLLGLIPRVPPPRTGQPSVFTVVSDTRVFAGDQVNVLTAAWLPRSLRLRLRQPPTLSPPTLPGVWSTPRPAVPGAVASREVEGETYDLFVGYQTAYPLNPGVIPIPPAKLSWMEPRGRQYFSEERREVVESAPVTIEVRSLPDAGRPADFDGPVARDLRIEYRLSESSARAGAVLPVQVVVSGVGNLPLWPVPKVAWPAGARVYEEGNETTSRLAGLRLGGGKTFRFAVVPDSAGSLSLPALEYAYFDPGQAAYRMARTPGIVVPVLEAAPTTDRRTPVPLEQPGALTVPERILGLPAVALGALVAAPLLLVAVAEWLRRRRPRRARQGPVADPVAQLEGLLRSFAPPGAPATTRALVAALRDAGLDRDRAERLVRLHFALEVERFGGQGSGVAPPGLQREIESALKEVPPPIRRAGGLAAAWTAVLFVAVLPFGLSAQSGFELYTRREYVPAAQAFRTEAEIMRPSPARWYDVAAAEYMAHNDAPAVAALLAARAQAPRDPYVKALWNALAREHEQLRRAARVWPLSAQECFALALAALWIGGLGWSLLRRWRIPWIVAAVLAAGFAGAGLVQRIERAGPRAVLVGGASLRVSPHGLAPERGAVPGFSLVRLERSFGTWWLVRTLDGAEGWIPANILARSPALD